MVGGEKKEGDGRATLATERNPTKTKKKQTDRKQKTTLGTF